MIVSASYRTDIPAFYGRWFARRLAAGWCAAVNPYSGKPYRIALRPPEVAGMVFWTRHVTPFLPVLDKVAEAGLPFVVQHTLTGYPRALEAAVAEPEKALAGMREVAHRFGPRALVWRHDPIVLSSLTPPAWQRAAFAATARRLEGVVDEVVVSFLQVYRKTVRNMAAAARAGGFTWDDPGPAGKQALLAELAPLAARHGIRLTLCGQPELLVPGVAEARCIDPARLQDLAGRPVPAAAQPHRACACAASRDIGAYDTCPEGCAYCYAVVRRAVARRHHAAHDADSPFLFAPPGTPVPEAPDQGRFL
ncbi:DUF1848 family protein [Roseospirillum parvum]|uniref:DNA repair photolyase n=1 Tax=Roseospirillum parvum TaxID=83401 RepID=A0A1G8DUS4_9PROT|nr:DUF1848 family protein [Roseospirillum parvum]SDH61348.1 protein of unknown function [Roseospirillum parvum]